MQQRLGPFSVVRPLIFARSEKLQRGRVAFDYTQKSTAFMGKEAEPSVSRFVCAARIAFLRAGENGRTEKESESKNPNKLPKDSADPSSRLDLPRPLLSIKLSRRGKERYSRGGILKRFVRFSSTGNRIEGGGEKAASSDSSSSSSEDALIFPTTARIRSERTKGRTGKKAIDILRYCIAVVRLEVNTRR